MFSIHLLFLIEYFQESTIQNPQYREMFQAQHFVGQTPFDLIETTRRHALCTNIIL